MQTKQRKPSAPQPCWNHRTGCPNMASPRQKYCRKCRTERDRARYRKTRGREDQPDFQLRPKDAEEMGRRRTCACGHKGFGEDFRDFSANTIRFRKTCLYCAWVEGEGWNTLSPYQHAMVQVELESGIPHTIWMRESRSIWNRRHYQLMATRAGVPILPGLRPVGDLYHFQPAGPPAPGEAA